MPLGPEFRINTYTTSSQTRASAATDAAGNFVVIWQSTGQDGNLQGVLGQRYGSTGAPLGSEFRINTYTTGFQLAPALAVDPTGNFVVVWASNNQDGSATGIFGQRYSSSGSPLGGEFRVNTFTTGDQNVPAVAADAAGNFVVVWDSYGQDGSSIGVFAQRYASSGAPLGAEFRVNSYTTGGQFAPSAAADPSGGFIVVWTGQDAAITGIVGQRYASSGAPLGPQFLVNTYTTQQQTQSSVATDSSGNFVVVWMSSGQDGSSSGVFGQRYASSGVPAGPEFRVNTYTTGYQGGPYPSVASDASGNFVVVWSSLNQDGSSYGVFGQRYSQIVPVELMRFGVE